MLTMAELSDVHTGDMRPALTFLMGMGIRPENDRKVSGPCGIAPRWTRTAMYYRSFTGKWQIV